MSSAAIDARDLGKTYRIRHNANAEITAAEALLRRVRHPVTRSQHEDFDALDELTFTIPWGEAVGILGRNGAGKSTLLKILTRVTAPTRGQVALGGRVGSLLEVGTGFHPELTGRENVYLNGTLLGMRRKGIKRRFEEIVEFSGVEKFLDTPVKRYSSGMYVRLAFSVAAHLDTEILAIDEVLAVGDAEFQTKCIEKMREAASHGRTVLFVSHQVQTVSALCTSALFLNQGKLVMQGSVEDALVEYKRSFARSAQVDPDPARRPGSGELRLRRVRPQRDVYESASEKVIQFSIGANPDYHGGNYFVSCHITDANRTIVLQCDSRVAGAWFDPHTEQHGVLRIGNPWLKPGRYAVDVYVCKAGIIDAWEGATTFDVMPLLPYEHATSAEGTDKGVVFADFRYEQAPDLVG